MKLELSFEPEKSGICLRVYEARDLKLPLKSSVVDPYVKCYLLPDGSKKTKRKTSVLKGTANPWWDEEMRWRIDPAKDAERQLQITLWDNAKKDFLGRATISVADVLASPGRKVDGWAELFDVEKGKHDFRIATVTAADPYVAVCEHAPGCDKELLLRIGDLLELVETQASTSEWSLVVNAITRAQGYVPTNFIACTSSLESYPWYFGKIARSKAEKLLMDSRCHHGSYLVRESESTKGQLSLSMRDGDTIRHYRVQDFENGTFKLWGSPADPQPSIPDLITFHCKRKAGLTTILRDPCPREQALQAADLSYETHDTWEVPRTAIQLGAVLGQGQYGDVYRGLYKGSIPVAVKTLKKTTSRPEDFLAEAAIMKKLRHPNVVSLMAVCSIGTPIYIVTELLVNGCLLDYLKSPAGEALRLPHLVDMCAQVAVGMAYLESMNYIHRDLAARNVLVGENNVCKVSDFGLARIVENQAYSPEDPQHFPVRWTAPEAMAKNKYTIKSDVWSFGVLLTEVITYGGKPYEGLKNKEVVQKLAEGYRMPCPRGCPEALYKLMMNCWKADPEERPTFETLKFQLEDFFSTGEHNYADPSTLMD